VKSRVKKKEKSEKESSNFQERRMLFSFFDFYENVFTVLEIE